MLVFAWIQSTVKMTSCLHIGLLCLVVVEGLPGPRDVPTCTDVDGKRQFFDGTQCQPCPTCQPGYGLSETCGDGQGVNAVCRPCPQGHFSDDDSMEMCRSCRICSDTMEDAVLCTSTSDRKCGPCSCGYFRYQERDDHCARCEDENYSHLYEECKSLPCPTPTPSSQKPVNTLTPEETSKMPTPTASLDPLVIIVIVVVGLVLLVIAVVAVVICLPEKRLHLCCFCCSWYRYEPVEPAEKPGSTTASQGKLPTVIYQPEDEENTPDGYPNITQEVQLRKSDSNGITCVEVPEDEPQIIPQEDVGIDSTEVSHESRQGAIPFFEEELTSSNLDEGSHDEGPENTSGSINSQEDHTGNPDTESGDSNCHVKSHSQGSIHSGDIRTENRDAEFDSKLQQALVATKDIGLESMDLKDRDLLNDMLSERPEVMEVSKRFHYGKMAERFGFNSDEIRQMTNAQQVLNQVAAKRKEQVTVADLLNSLVQSGKCFNVVRKLVDQIVERQQH